VRSTDETILSGSARGPCADLGGTPTSRRAFASGSAQAAALEPVVGRARVAAVGPKRQQHYRGPTMRQVRPIKAVVGPARAVDDSSDEPGVSMLRSTEIALACGLSDQSAFSNTFRGVIGVAARLPQPLPSRRHATRTAPVFDWKLGDSAASISARSPTAVRNCP